MVYTAAQWGGRESRRAAIVDLGSNSVRMVVYEGVARNPVPIFNEKATLRLGAGLEATGMLSEEGINRALEVLARYQAIGQAMKVEPFDVLATAAVRDAHNGADFVKAAKARMPEARFRVLNGEEEADYSAAGVLCALPDADGVVADIGGGSLELIRVRNGAYFEAGTTPLGVIRLRERSQEDLGEASKIARKTLADVSWLETAAGKPLYLVGGAFRALARLHVARMEYPLNMVHLFRLSRAEAEEMAGWVIGASRKQMEKIGNVPRKRMVDAPFAAQVLLALLAQTDAQEVVFSAEGLREGWYMREVASSVAEEDPMEALAREMAGRLGRNASLAEPLITWVSPVFLTGLDWVEDSFLAAQLRLACTISDIGSYDHPQYRAEQTYRRVLYCHGVGFSHESRAFLALVLAVRYEINRDDPVLEPSRRLLSKGRYEAAVQLGLVLRLVYTLCAGTEVLLERTHLAMKDDKLVLSLHGSRLRSGGSAISRQLERLAEALGMKPSLR
ncbi:MULTISPECIES: Ppx/GppA family phosphatase [Acetobacteraceae]|uniref:Ppx/GppA family phosphatase n=1 Tax=Acetobacteraceae TaxID=433 RepID=UPI000A3659D3|nr:MULTISPECIES: Ppx/GppA family phosphatase [Acetobacteraceae]MCQ0042012.1 Ppx/GppA family phosphatase [Bombella sp.]MUH02579.1 Ppx/GppA family phosphatase [Bombella sp. ESL0387]MCL1513181.1 Ppx/GppA family phosphatase [Parasaccharibacter sp. TMW 2.1891]MCL1514756.1 exopolyphosphatase [Parasaccharibacter sp. TMW2.1890]MPW00553.1 Ppx/GppA family phosphatase [Bombella apis]